MTPAGENNETISTTTTVRLKHNGKITIIIPKEVRTAHNLIEGDVLDINIDIKSQGDDNHNQDTKTISTNFGKIKYIKKIIRELQMPHPEGKIYITFDDLAKNAASVGIKKDDLETILTFLNTNGDIIELPKNCWRTA